MFKELKILQTGAYGWFIAIEANGSGWLTRNGIIETSTKPIENYYFDSELDAYCATLNYYCKHNHAYPYFNELHKLRKEHRDNDDDVKDISGSQTMDFE